MMEWIPEPVVVKDGCGTIFVETCPVKKLGKIDWGGGTVRIGTDGAGLGVIDGFTKFSLGNGWV